MKIETWRKEAFTVIGKEGSTAEGGDFIRRLWSEANAHFEEVAALAKKDENGQLVGVWGAMSDLSRSFRPWESFEKGLYLAGVECEDGAEAPEGWTKWVVPGYEFLRAERENEDSFSQVLQYMEDNGIPLAGAVHDFSDPQTGKDYMCFPTRRL
ncbi:MAG: GyrI-like domain-containing protein [Oscillospiraceae bacterium]|nr:GyrI-like domain-containing protein [Oscillospiraceae bacterium]